MTLIAYTSPSGRAGTYKTNGGDSQRIKALTSLLCLSLTEDGTPEEHLDNMFQAAICLKAELAEIDTSQKDEWLRAAAAIEKIQTALGEFVDGGSE